MYRANVYVTLHEEILDPEGKAILKAIEYLDLKDVSKARVGKYINLDIDVKDEKEARKRADEICKRLLHNPVIENYRYEVSKYEVSEYEVSEYEVSKYEASEEEVSEYEASQYEASEEEERPSA